MYMQADSNLCCIPWLTLFSCRNELCWQVCGNQSASSVWGSCFGTCLLAELLWRCRARDLVVNSATSRVSMRLSSQVASPRLLIVSASGFSQSVCFGIGKDALKEITSPSFSSRVGRELLVKKLKLGFRLKPVAVWALSQYKSLSCCFYFFSWY